jgi:hypothetical protein
VSQIESEGITENVKAWRTDVPAEIIDTLGLESVMFEAADPDVFAWYIKSYGPGGQSLCGSQPDRAARVFPFRHLGDRRCLETYFDLQGRLAVEGEELVAHRFKSGSTGIVACRDLERWATERPRTFWRRLRDEFSSGNEPSPVVCIPPGARLRLIGIPDTLKTQVSETLCKNVVFTQISAEINQQRDALFFCLVGEICGSPIRSNGRRKLGLRRPRTRCGIARLQLFPFRSQLPFEPVSPRR